MLKSIVGRSGEPIVLPNGRRINANLPSYIFKPLAKIGVIRRYRFVHEPGNELKLYMVITNGFTDEHMEIVKRETQLAFGEGVPFSVHLVNELPFLSNAKHRDYVVADRRDSHNQ
jgi:hypothetical protein